MKLELTIKVTYLPEWGKWEGVRELIQNARDEEVRTGIPMVVRHTGKTLRLFNEKSALRHRDLLFGQTDKADRSDFAGKFGEGLKLGTLALIRGGFDVKIRTGTEIWTPAIEHSQQFGEQVLVFNIRRSSKDIGGTQVDVGGLTAMDWTRMREKFLFLASLGSDEAIDVPGQGKIITAARFKGKLFVKGIFVQDGEDYLYGYDFESADVDRDRKLIDPWDLKWKTAAMWRQIVSGASGRQFVGDFYNALVEDSPDVKSLQEYGAKQLPEEIVDELKSRFEAVHGDLAVPVTSLAESRDLGYLGFNGVIVGEALMNALLARSGGIKGLKEKSANNVLARYSWQELSEAERDVFDRAVAAFSLSGYEMDLDKLEVVRFKDERQMGKYSDGRIFLSRSRLTDVSEALGTLIHEHAHAYGPDGSQQHTSAIERMWVSVHGATIKENAE